MSAVRRPRGLLAATALAMAALVGGLLPAAAASAATPPAVGPSTCAPDPLTCPERLHVGVSTPGLPTDPAALDRWADATGHSPTVAMSFHGLAHPVSTDGLKALVAAGRLPMVTLEPWERTAPETNPYPMARLAAGDFDGLLRAQAEAVAAVGAPVAVRFGHEMNGDWYPWGLGVNGTTAEDLVAAWRHVHDVFEAAGADVVWTWAPNLIDFDPRQDLAALYPGDDVVDWVGLSGYFDEEADRYATLYGPTLAQLDRVAPDKPVYVAETSVLPGPRRAAMISDLLTGFRSTPRVIGFTWFDHVGRFDWRLEDDAAAAAQMRLELDTGWFLAGPGDGPAAQTVPVPTADPVLTGPPHVGVVLSATQGRWRTTSDSPAVLTGRWYRCLDATSTASCTPTAGTSRFFSPSRWDLQRHLRHQVTATSAAGSAVSWSAPTRSIVMLPAQPAAPAVEARDRALRLVLPPAPVGATHWQLAVGGVPRPLVRVGAATELWVTGLVNGVPTALSLAAVSASSTDSLVGPATSGTAVAMPVPWTPYIRVTAPVGAPSVATVHLPTTVPTGAQAWTLSVDGGPPVTLAIGTRTYDVVGAGRGVPHSVALRAVAGSWPGRDTGSVTPAATAWFTAPATVARSPVRARALPG